MIRQATTNFYQVLGVAQTATPAEIKKAYRKLALQLHPDVTGNTAGEARFKEISVAHGMLSDPNQRSEYDSIIASFKRAQASRPSNSPASQTTSAPMYVADNFEWNESLLREEWEDFISLPFTLSQFAIATYIRWEWLLGIATLPIFYLILTGKLTGESLFIFMFSKASAPGVDSAAPFVGLIIGAATGWGITLLSLLHAVMTHRYSFRHNVNFREDVFSQAGDMIGMLNILGAFIGLMIGRYLI